MGHSDEVARAFMPLDDLIAEAEAQDTTTDPPPEEDGQDSGSDAECVETSDALDSFFRRGTTAVVHDAGTTGLCETTIGIATADAALEDAVAHRKRASFLNWLAEGGLPHLTAPLPGPPGPLSVPPPTLRCTVNAVPGTACWEGFRPVRVLPKADNNSSSLLLVRTDYRDDEAWQRVLAALDQPWVFDERDTENGSLKEEVFAVDDPAWAGASPADVLAALTASGDGTKPFKHEWPVLFLADSASMQGAEPTLLAVSPDPEETAEPYRIPALSVPHEMHCNLALANMDFDEFESAPFQ